MFRMFVRRIRHGRQAEPAGGWVDEIGFSGLQPDDSVRFQGEIGKLRLRDFMSVHQDDGIRRFRGL